MLITIDIGNTNVVFACFKDEKIFNLKREKIKNFSIEKAKINFFNTFDKKKVKKIIIASVVPSLDKEIFEFCKKQITQKTKLLTINDVLAVMPSKYKEHSNLGIDRILNSFAAFHKYKTSLIVVDIGTATTFDIVSNNGTYLGGMITFGPKIAANALSSTAEKIATN